MDQQENDEVQSQIDNSFQDGGSGDATPPTPEGTPNPQESGDTPPETPPQGISANEATAMAEAAVAKAEANWLREQHEKGDQTPKPDILQEAIDSLPDESQKEIAKDLKPVLEKMLDNRGGYVSADEAKKLAEEAATDAINIQHLEQWKGNMSKEWDGQNGKPKFDFAKLDKFMEEKGMTDPDDAFYLMNKNDLIKYSASITKKPKPTVDQAGGTPPPAQGSEQKFPDDKNQAVAEATNRAEARLKAQGY